MPTFIEKIVLEDFTAKVKRMRDLQKLFFKDRGPGILAISKAAERDVDDAVEKFLDKQRNLL